MTSVPYSAMNLLKYSITNSLICSLYQTTEDYYQIDCIILRKIIDDGNGIYIDDICKNIPLFVCCSCQDTVDYIISNQHWISDVDTSILLWSRCKLQDVQHMVLINLICITFLFIYAIKAKCF